MVIVYYVNTYYLDAALETIQAVKNVAELHVLIEVSPESRKTNIIDIGELNGFNYLEKPETVLGPEKWKQIERYFEGVAGVQFVVHGFKRSLSLASYKTAALCGKYINTLKPDVIHFDSISPRLIGMYPYLVNKKIFITVHDPVPHSGEGSWKIKMTEYVFFHLAKGLFFYSRFASEQFAGFYPGISAGKYVIRFQPFTFIQQFASDTPSESNGILFFGRILVYKGVDMLLEAIPAVLKKYPDEKFIIAGEPLNCELDQQLLNRYRDNIQVISAYISTENLARLIKKSKFVICPYRDATQSGVLMTAYALGKMVVGTNVGAFPEYIHDDVNGILMEPDPASIADKIITALDGEHYKILEKNITAGYSRLIGEQNRQCLLTAFRNG